MNLLKLGILIAILFSANVSFAQAATADDYYPSPEPVHQYQSMDSPPPPPTYKVENPQPVPMYQPSDGGSGLDRPLRHESLSSHDRFWDDFLPTLAIVSLVIFAILSIGWIMTELFERGSRRDYLEWTHEYAKPIKYVGSNEAIERAVSMVAGEWKDEAEHYADQTKKDVGDDRYEVTLYVPLKAEATMSSLLETIRATKA